MDFYQIPLGFGMALTRNPSAMNAYSAMTDPEKQAIVAKARRARSEQEMYQLVDQLANHRLT